MGATKIEWTDKTWNPVTGCTKVSQGCKNCYAERIFKWPYGKEEVLFSYSEKGGPIYRAREFTDVKCHPERLDQPLHWKKPKRVFVNSMSDLFHEAVPLPFLQNIWRVMVRAHRERGHIFQVLTKRPQRMLDALTKMPPDGFQWYAKTGEVPCPEPGIWLGVSIEDQPTADERIPLLIQTPAAVRFISAEPLLAAVDLDCWPESGCPRGWLDEEASLDWVICGGESGPNARPMQEEWARSLMQQCKAAGVPFFMKQGSKANWPDFKNFESFPKDLQIREYPPRPD